MAQSVYPYRLRSFSAELTDWRHIYLFLLSPYVSYEPQSYHSLVQISSPFIYTYTSVSLVFNQEHCIRSPSYQPLAAREPEPINFVFIADH